MLHVEEYRQHEFVAFSTNWSDLNVRTYQVAFTVLYSIVKNGNQGRAQWLTPVIPALWEAEADHKVRKTEGEKEVEGRDWRKIREGVSNKEKSRRKEEQEGDRCH